MFRFKRSVPVSYDRQGFIYFASRLYRELPDQDREEIRRLCRECGGEYEQALLEFVTTDAGAVRVCAEHHLSRSTLERATRRYYKRFGQIRRNRGFDKAEGEPCTSVKSAGPGLTNR